MRLLKIRAVRLALRAAAGLVTIVVVLPLLAFAVYDVAYFQPRSADIDAILAAADPEERSPPPLVRDMIVAAHHSKRDLCNNTSRQLLTKLDLLESPHRNWHVRYFLWSQLMCLHYSEAENFVIFSALAYTGSDNEFGLSYAAQQRFHKKLDELSPEEAAELMALAHSPYLLLRKPGSLEMETRWILQRYHDHSMTD